MTTLARLPATTRGRTVWPLALVILAAVSVAVLYGGPSAAPRRDAPDVAPGFRMTRAADGLLAADSFDVPRPRRMLDDFWEPDPKVPPGLGTYEATADGLVVGIDAHQQGTWEGNFLVTRDMYPETAVFHVDAKGIPARVEGASDEAGEVVLAIQTGSTKVTGDINFVVVNTITVQGDLDWIVGYSEGRVANASLTTYETIEDVPPGLDTTSPVPITVRTDGSENLDVWLGNEQVLDRSDLAMNIEPPFQPYLEVQARTVGYSSVFTNFWVTRDDSIVLEGLPEGTVATLAGQGQVLATGTVGADGRVRLTPPLPYARGKGDLRVRLPGKGTDRTVAADLPYAGGDVYSVEIEEEPA